MVDPSSLASASFWRWRSRSLCFSRSARSWEWDLTGLERDLPGLCRGLRRGLRERERLGLRDLLMYRRVVSQPLTVVNETNQESENYLEWGSTVWHKVARSPYSSKSCVSGEVPCGASEFGTSWGGFQSSWKSLACRHLMFEFSTGQMRATTKLKVRPSSWLAGLLELHAFTNIHSHCSHWMHDVFRQLQLL